jgi:outer membrane protein
VADQTELLAQYEARLIQARSGLLPSVALSETYSAAIPPGMNPGSFRVTLSQPLFSGLRYLSLYQQADFLARAQTAQLEWTRIQTCSETAAAYYALLTARSELEHTSDLVSIYDKRIREFSGLVAIGKSRPQDLVSLKAARSLAVAQQIQATGLLTNSRRNFTFLTGLPGDAELPETSVSNIPSGVPISGLFLSSNRADIRAARYKAEASRKNLQAAQALRWPAVNAGGGVTVPNRMNTGRASLTGDIGLSLSLFSGGSVTGKIREAESAARQSQNVYWSVSETADRDLSAARTGFETDLAQWRAVSEAVRYQRENLSLVETDYSYGTQKLTDVLTALSSLQDALRSGDRLKYAVLLDLVRLDILSGRFQLPEAVSP